MKKRVLFIAACVSWCFSTLNAQVIFNDDFSNSNLPNWTIVNQSNSNVIWEWANTGSSTGSAAGDFEHAGASNGYIIVDSDADGDQNTPTAERTLITSKAIDCSTASTVLFSFYQFYAKFQGDTPRVYVSNDSATWTAVHNPALGFAPNDATANPDYVELDVTAVAANQATVYIRFEWRGKWDYWWFVDDVTLFIPATNSVEAVAVQNQLSNGCNLSNAESIGVSFRNKGLDSITTISASYQVDNGTVVTETVNLPNPLPRDSVYAYTFTQTADLSTAGLYQITAWLNLAGDTVQTNDTAFSIALSADPINVTTPYTMGFEVPNFGTEIDAFTWTTLDANNDGATWNLSAASPYQGGVHFRYFWNPNGTTAANDWLFSPCLNLDSTKAYRLSFYSQVGEDDGGLYEERLRIKAGTDKSAIGMTETVFDFGELANSEYAQQVVSFKPVNTGIYYLGFQCYSAADKWFLDVDSINLSVLAPPTASFTTNANQLIVGVTDASADAITSWTWTWGDGTSDTGAAPSPHVYAQNGTYEICLIVNNFAGSDTSCQSVTVQSVGINDVAATGTVSVYPNPSNGVVNVQMSEGLKDNAVVTISNAIGEKVAVKAVKSYKEQFDLTGYAEGVYFVNITSGTQKITKKFVYVR